MYEISSNYGVTMNIRKKVYRLYHSSVNITLSHTPFSITDVKTIMEIDFEKAPKFPDTMYANVFLFSFDHSRSVAMGTLLSKS